MTDACVENGMELIPPPRHPQSQSYEESTEFICARFIEDKLDGVIFTPVEHIENAEAFNRAIISRLNDAGIPLVLLDRDVVDWPQQTPNDLVGIDNIQAGFVITQHLIDRGCSSFLFLTRPKPAMTVQLRIMGCREALLNAGHNPQSLHVLEMDAETELTADHLLQYHTDGLICANDATAAYALRLLVDAGVAIPEQLSVAGFDDVKYASLLTVPLTTYRQPCEDIGKASIHVVQHRINYPGSAPQRITLQGELIVRRSTNHH